MIALDGLLRLAQLAPGRRVGDIGVAAGVGIERRLGALAVPRLPAPVDEARPECRQLVDRRHGDVEHHIVAFVVRRSRIARCFGLGGR